MGVKTLCWESEDGVKGIAVRGIGVGTRELENRKGRGRMRLDSSRETGYCGGRRRKELQVRQPGLIKKYILRDVESSIRRETPIPFVIGGIAQKQAFLRFEFQFVSMIRP